MFLCFVFFAAGVSVDGVCVFVFSFLLILFLMLTFDGYDRMVVKRDGMMAPFLTNHL